MTRWTRAVPVVCGLLLCACSAKVKGPEPAPVSVRTEKGTNVICTCDALQGCIKDKSDVLTVSGTDFAPLPVRLLDDPNLELPTVTLHAPTPNAQNIQDFVIDGADPTKNFAGVTLAFKSTEELEITLPPEYVATFPEGKYTVIVDNPNGKQGVLPDGLEVTMGPVLETVTPSVICNEVDSTIELKGKNFREGVVVVIGDDIQPKAQVTRVDSATIRVVIPKGHLVGKFDVSVENPEGCGSTMTEALEVVPPPTLTALAPVSVCQGGAVTLTGTGFRAGASVILTSGTESVELKDDAVTVQNETTLQVLLQLTPPGVYDVAVKNVDGCTSTKLPTALTVTPGPLVMAIDPSTVYNKVNFPISIFGTQFVAGMTATINTTPTPTSLTITNVDVTAGRIDAVVPKNVPKGTYNVTVNSPGGCSFVFAGGLIVTDELSVRICGIDPAFGWTNENTPVTISSGTGTGCSAGTKQFASTPRAWLDVNETLVPLDAVAFVTDASLTGSVPKSLTVGGPYDLLVQNPDGSIGLKEDAFTVVSLPVPRIDTINPGDEDTQYVGNFTLTGANFRTGTIELIDSAGNKKALPAPTVSGGGTQASTTLNVANLALAPNAYVVRYTNTDQHTYTDFSAFALTNPAGNLGAWTEVSSMAQARRRHALVHGRVSSAARFLYAMGGDSGGASPALLDSVELVPLDKFGGTGTWVTQRYKLAQARTGLVAVAQGRYIYVIGGKGASAELDSIARAQIQVPEEAPQIESFSFAYGTTENPGKLKKGTWYYRVAAVMDDGNAFNPGGETLPSDPVIMHAIDDVKATLTWAAVAGAKEYWIYRTPTVNGTSGGERMLAKVELTACSGASCTFTDQGAAASEFQGPTVAPQAMGATGVFVPLATKLLHARSGAALNVVPAGGGGLYVYVSGGRAGSTVLSSVEMATLSADGATLGSFSEARALTSNRERHMLVVGEPDTSKMVPADTYYLYAAGGYSGTAVDKTGIASLVGAAGALGAWGGVDATKNVTMAAVGYLINDTFYYFGGSSDGTTGIAQAFSCEYENTVPLPGFKNCNSLAAGALPAARMNAALTLESAFFYIAGGGATDAEATTTVYKTVY